MRKIAVLGGSFNPVHLAHLAMAEQASARLGLDKVLFIPARIPPHKISAALAPGDQRLEMLRLAIAGRPEFEACDIELRRDGPSYTIDTVEELRRQYGKDAEIYFLIGLDSVNELRTWRDIRRLASRCKFVPMDRPGASEPDSAALCRAVGEEEARAILARRIHMTLMDISSSDVRASVAAGRAICRLVPPAVEEYIHRMELYQEATSPAPSQPRRCCGGA
jgi:nicotinate-nucleotide adenylyltransferase